MREVGTVLGGIGTLIFAYLVIANYTASTSIVTGVSSSGVNLIAALQGRAATG